jgi:hypothetical protein
MQIKLVTTYNKKEQQQDVKSNDEFDRMDEDDLEDLQRDY